MRAAIAACIACGCGRIGFDSSSADPDLVHRKLITITPGGTPLAEFPLALIVASDPQLAARAKPDGRDLRFAAADGATPLAFEIESYDGASGALVAWIRMPLLDGPTYAYLYYGGEPLDTPSPEQTWPPNYLGVWHLSGSDREFDRTSRGHHLDPPTPARSPPSVSGLAGPARRYNGVDHSLVIPDPPDGGLDMGPRSFSVSLWVRVTQSVGFFDMPLHKGGSADSVAGYDLELGTLDWRLDIGDGTQSTYAEIGQETSFLGQWMHVVSVVDRSTQTLRGYANGVLAGMIDITAIGSVDSPEPFELGQQVNMFSGDLDEVHLYSLALPPEWIAAEFRNLSAPSTFASLGAEEKLP